MEGCEILKWGRQGDVEAGLDAGGWRLGVGGWGLEAVGEMLGVGGRRRLEVGGLRSKAGGRRLDMEAGGRFLYWNLKFLY